MCTIPYCFVSKAEEGKYDTFILLMYAQENFKRILITMVTWMCIGRGNHSKRETHVERTIFFNILNHVNLFLIQKDVIIIVGIKIVMLSMHYLHYS